MAVPATRALTQAYEGIASALPSPLLRFFRRFPPGSVPQTAPTAIEVTLPGSNPSAKPITRAIVATGQRPTEPILHPTLDSTYNPFLPWRNPVTKAWRPPLYSMRRQAELVKLAREHGMEELLPYTEKLSWVKQTRLEERGGTAVRGTGVGQKVKGKKWERRLRGTLESRREAMRGMPELVKKWKERGHGRGWKKWPK